MKYIEATHQELRDKAANALRESRKYEKGSPMQVIWRTEYSSYALAAIKLKNAMFRERCAAKGVEV